MQDINNLVKHAIDKEVFVVQAIMRTLEQNGVSYDEWERLLPVLTALVDEQVGCGCIRYMGE
jgi:predicted pyridoxine 5'-phosphate oxidase superfamily flavin-nucleotide-binding protein